MAKTGSSNQPMIDGEAGERRARDLVGNHDDVGGQVRRRLVGAPHRQADHGEHAAEKREVALQQRLALQAQSALVTAHAPRLAAGKQHADPYRFPVCLEGAHGEVESSSCGAAGRSGGRA